MTGPEVPLVIGVGNEDRCDDGVGPRAARMVLETLGSSVRVAEVPGPVTDLLDLWSGGGDVYVVDAIDSGSAPGTVHRFLIGAEPLPARLGATSTHGLSLSDAIALSAALDCRPRRLVVYGIKVSTLAPGAGLTPSVEGALPALVDRLTREIRERIPVAP